LLGEATPSGALMQIGLVPEIGDAIVHRAGLLGAMLTMAEAAETGGQDVDVSHSHPELAALTSTVVAEINLEAAVWARAHESV